MSVCQVRRLYWSTIHQYGINSGAVFYARSLAPSFAPQAQRKWPDPCYSSVRSRIWVAWLILIHFEQTHYPEFTIGKNVVMGRDSAGR
jgi:hypothetical protein